MVDNGWIKLHRRILEAPEWQREPFTKAQAWIDLLLLANFKDTHFYVRGNRVDVKRGQIGYSIVSLSERWKWSLGKVKRYLNELETAQQIEQQNNHLTTIITIVKWDKYQSNSTADDTADGIPDKTSGETSDRTSDGIHLKNSKNSKNDKNVKEDSLLFKIEQGESETEVKPKKSRPKKSSYNPDYSDEFLRFWEAYPSYKKNAKIEAYRIWEERLWNGQSLDSKIDKIIESLESWKETPQWYKDKGKFIPNATTFLNGGTYETTPKTKWG